MPFSESPFDHAEFLRVTGNQEATMTGLSPEKERYLRSVGLKEEDIARIRKDLEKVSKKVGTLKRENELHFKLFGPKKKATSAPGWQPIDELTKEATPGPSPFVAFILKKR
jgi:hypothetical protein